MANKSVEKTPISYERFMTTVKEKGSSIRKLGKVAAIDRDEKTIRRYLAQGEMPPDLLDKIGKYLDVDPQYLAGFYDRYFEEIKETLVSPELTHYLWTKVERFPYSKHMKEQIDGKELFTQICISQDISIEQIQRLNNADRMNLQMEIGRAIDNVFMRFFNKDGNGKEMDAAYRDVERIPIYGIDWFST